MRWNVFLTAFALAAVPAMAQDVVSAKAGLVHEAEGEVMINGDEFYQEGLRFTSMKEGDTLSTRAGRAEILLNAGSILRVGEDSSFNLVAASLTDTRLKLESGMVTVEVADLPKETSVTLEVDGRQIALRKRGLYEFSAESPSRVRVYEGELAINNDKGESVRITKEHQYDLDSPNGEVSKFDAETDNSALYRWGARRARTLMAASQSTPRSSVSFTNVGMYNGVWAYNPLLGMYSYIPIRGTIYSPYAAVIYIPVARAPVSYGGSGNGGGSSVSSSNGGFGGRTSSGGGSVSASPGAAAAPAGGAPAMSSPNAGGGGVGAGRRR
jgi:hypothetical protein